MRYWLAWLVAYAFATGSTTLACLYSFMSAGGWYAFAKALILGLVAFGGCHGPAYVVKLQRSVGWPGSALAVFATAFCLLVTLMGGLGTITAGGAELRAERSKITGDARRNQSELERLQKERGELPRARPADTVAAEIAIAKASALYKASDGCDPDRITGKSMREHCATFRRLEGELAAAREATRLDGEIATANGKLAASPATPEDDPQASAISAITGWKPDFSRAFYALMASIAAELMGMVAMMVAWQETKGAKPAETIAISVPSPIEVRQPPTTPVPPAIELPELPALPPPREERRPAAVIPMRKPAAGVFGSVKKFAASCITPATGERLELQAVWMAYQGWCKANALQAADLDRFLQAAGDSFEIELEGTKAYCINVRLAA